MAFDFFGIKKRHEELKKALKAEIERELQANSQALLQDWSEEDERTGRNPKVSYTTLQSLYRKESWVRAGIDIIQRTFISNGFRLVSVNDDFEFLSNNEIAPIINILEAPNKEDTLSDIFSDIVIDLHIYGDAYVEIVKNPTTGLPIALYNVYAPSIKVLVDKHGIVLGYIQTLDSFGKRRQEPVIFEPDEIMHFKLPNPGNEVYGLSPLESLFLPIETDLWAQNYNLKFFQNHATPRLHLDLGSCSLPQLKRTREYFRSEFRGTENAHKTLITEGGAKINVIGVNPNDMEFLNQRKFSRDEILSVLGVPPMKVGIFEDVNRASAIESDKSFKSEKIIPLQRMIAKKINLSLISKFNRNVKFEFVELDLRDAKEQAEIDQIDIESGIRTIDEVRRSRGLPPKDKIKEPEETTVQESNPTINRDIHNKIVRKSYLIQ